MKSNRTSANSVLASVITVIAFVIPSAHAALIRTANDSAFFNQQAYAGTILANDLIGQGTTTLLNAVQANYAPYADSEPANTILNDGSNGADTNPSTNIGSAFDSDGIFTVTYNLNLTIATLGYDLTRIRSYAAHFDNRTGQNYSVLVDYVNDGLGNFVSLGSFIGTNAGGVHQASRVTLENDVSPGLTAFTSGVAAIQFITAPATPAATVWREFDVEGVATVPEPSTILFGMIGTAGIFSRRNRNTRNA